MIFHKITVFYAIFIQISADLVSIIVTQKKVFYPTLKAALHHEIVHWLLVGYVVMLRIMNPVRFCSI